MEGYPEAKVLWERKLPQRQSRQKSEQDVFKHPVVHRVKGVQSRVKEIIDSTTLALIEPPRDYIQQRAEAGKRFKTTTPQPISVPSAIVKQSAPREPK